MGKQNKYRGFTVKSNLLSSDAAVDLDNLSKIKCKNDDNRDSDDEPCTVKKELEAEAECEPAGDFPSPSSFTSSSSDDEDLSLWTPGDELSFLRTLSALKEHDPKIYEKDVHFFGDKDGATIDVRKRQKKYAVDKMTLRDYESRLVLEKEGQLDESDEDEEEKWRAEDAEAPKEFEKELKQAIKDALSSSESENDCDHLLKKRVKTDDEKVKEDDDYYQWLKGERVGVDVIDKHLEKLKARWSNDAKLDENEKFLRDYLLYKKYEDCGEQEENGESIPTYEEIIQDEEDEELADQFEHKYNFRFEEPDQEFLKQYPRTVREALRKPESKRKRKREKLKKQQQEEGEKKNRMKVAEVDIPFRYRAVLPNSFGLTTEEILNTEDRWLNAWVPISRISQYRSDDQERHQLMYFKSKAQNKELKRKVLRKDAEKEDAVSDAVAEYGQKDAADADAETRKETSTPRKMNKPQKKKTTKKGRLEDGRIDLDKLGKERLKAYGVSTKKLKRVQYVKRMAEKRECGIEEAKKKI